VPAQPTRSWVDLATAVADAVAGQTAVEGDSGEARQTGRQCNATSLYRVTRVAVEDNSDNVELGVGRRGGGVVGVRRRTTPMIK
jgi:hypothetical protein